MPRKSAEHGGSDGIWTQKGAGPRTEKNRQAPQPWKKQFTESISTPEVSRTGLPQNGNVSFEKFGYTLPCKVHVGFKFIIIKYIRSQNYLRIEMVRITIDTSPEGDQPKYKRVKCKICDGTRRFLQRASRCTMCNLWSNRLARVPNRSYTAVP
jgi:hypothetical protein